MATKRSGLKLVHKGLILVSIPLVFGFAFILYFESVMQTVMHQRDKNVHALAVANQIYKLSSAIFEAEVYLSGGQQLSDERLDKLNTDVLKSFAQLKARVSKDVRPSQSELDADAALSEAEDHDNALMKLKADAVGDFFRLNSLVQQDTQPANSAKQVDDLRLEWAKARQYMQAIAIAPNQREQCLLVLRDLHAKLNQFGRSELYLNAPDNVAVKQLDKSMQQVLALAIALNVILCPMLALYFSQNLVRRLSILIENSQRLAEGKALVQPIVGNDEISEVDSVFRGMADTIQKVEQAKKEFVAMVSHDLRTPLNAVQATLTLIADGVYGNLSSEGIKRAKVAEETSGQLIDLVNQLLDLEKVKSGKLELSVQPTQLSSVIQQSIATISGFASFKNIDVEVTDTDLAVLADEKRLIQVLVNLLANAIKFAPDNSTVSVSVHGDYPGQVEVRVHDRGQGIDAESKSVIFDRFRQGGNSDESSFKGSGLGLTICKEIIEAHQGTIGVDSKNGNGSTFWFRLRKAEKAVAKDRLRS